MFRTGPKLIYFAHVPKCAGSSMMKYLQNRFGALAFHDDSFHLIPGTQRWSKTSPQHINAEALHRLFPEDFFDASFTVVRHPVSRLVSSFHFQQEVEKSIPPDTDFGTWLHNIEEAYVQNPYIYDNHVRPMNDIVPKGAKIFYLEQSFDIFVSWLDELMGDTDGPRTLPKINKRGSYSNQKTEKVVPSTEQIEQIARFYARDFDRFGYVPDNLNPMGQLKDDPPERRPLKGILRALGLS
nr:sulfotransferase family 2 domain-containing protein [Pseudohalocynthiibacter sp. F2068]